MVDLKDEFNFRSVEVFDAMASLTWCFFGLISDDKWILSLIYCPPLEWINTGIIVI